MRQVVDNLISNAIKYSAEGTNIELVARIESDQMLTAVIYQGIGIPTDATPKLFERFHRARNAPSRYYGGPRPGLSISKAAVHAHTGSTHYLSRRGPRPPSTVP